MGYTPPHKPVENKKPSTLITFLALFLTCLIPYFLVTHYRQENSEQWANTQRTLNLPKPKQIVKKSPAETPAENHWLSVKCEPGDSLATLFKRVGLTAKDLQALIQDNPHRDQLNQLQTNQKIQFLIKNKQLEKMIVPLTIFQNIVVYKEGGKYLTKLTSRKMNSHSHYVTAVVKDSLYNTAKRAHIPLKLINQMSEIFNWDIDFAKDIRAGDQFTIIYKAYYIEDQLVGTGDIVAVTLKNRGKVYQAVLHKNKNAQTGYYDPNGQNMQKSFNRYPVDFSHISSSFSRARQHPVLNYIRAHKGIDLAAPMGAPIHATSDGVIKFIGRNHGYGNMIKITHNKTYDTVYAHMKKFRKGLKRGSKVKRGQLIGYVGQSGLATGPHCHYEFHVNNLPRNPSKVKLPKAAPVPKSELDAYKSNAQALLAHASLFAEAYLASKQNQRLVG